MSDIPVRVITSTPTHVHTHTHTHTHTHGNTYTHSLCYFNHITADVRTAEAVNVKSETEEEIWRSISTKNIFLSVCFSVCLFVSIYLFRHQARLCLMVYLFCVCVCTCVCVCVCVCLRVCTCVCVRVQLHQVCA